MTHGSIEHPLAAPGSRTLAGPALRAFFRITSAWGLKSIEERVLLGHPPESTFFKWKKDEEGSLSRDVLERISYVLGIYKALQILFLSLPRRRLGEAAERRTTFRGPAGARSDARRQRQRSLRRPQYLDAQRGW